MSSNADISVVWVSLKGEKRSRSLAEGYSGFVLGEGSPKAAKRYITALAEYLAIRIPFTCYLL